MESSTVKNDEIPSESRFNFYVTVVTVIIVGVCVFSLYLHDADPCPPEIVFPFCLILLYTFLQDMVFLWTTKHPEALCYKNAFILIILLIYFYFNSKAKSEREVRLMNKEVFTLNSGSMLAYGYYYGYLKLILPGIKEKIEDFINRHEGGNEGFRKIFPVKKLFILIPSSSFSYDKPDSDSNMEQTYSLEEHIQDRALTIERVYKNTMYKIKKAAKEKYYVLPEIATPTETLYETCKEQKHVAEYKEEIVTSFYHTLQKLLNDDPICGRVCELIYYKDSEKSTSDGVNLADIITKRVKKIKREEMLRTS